MARRTRNFRRQLPKRNLFWTRITQNGEFQEDDVAAQVNLLSTFESEYGAKLYGFTVERIRGHYTFWCPNDESGTGLSAPAGIISYGIRKDERRDSSQPDWGIADTDEEQADKIPTGDPYADWMFVRNQAFAIAGMNEDQQVALHRQEIDIKSKRKLSELGESLYLMHGVAPTNESVVFPVAYAYQFNVLLRQP